MSKIIILCLISFTSLVLILLYSKFAKTIGLYDKPNERSTHTKPIPLGAGLTFILCLTPSVFYFKYTGLIESNSYYMLLIGALFCTVLGFVDDVRHLSAKFRLIVQFIISLSTLLYLTNFLNITFEVKFLPFNIPVISLIFGVLFVMWMVNLFNFVDGIDGLLGSQVFVYGLFFSYFCLISNNSALSLVYLALSALTLPFLIFNWRPAKVFMGDAGAYFLGFCFAFLGLVGKIEYGQSLVANVILMSPIISDATYTLILRAQKRKKIFGAHRDHLFHIMLDSKKLKPCKIVTLYSLLTVFLTAPTAYFSTVKTEYAVLICAITYASTLLIYIWVKKTFKTNLA
jgi:Fuc2NAc and GlcNAc transferase